MSKLLIFCERKSEWAICNKKKAIRSFALLSLCKLLTVALLSWAPWAIRSLWLICHEQPEQLLMVANLFWAIWANHSQSLIKMTNFEQISKFPTLVKSEKNVFPHNSCRDTGHSKKFLNLGFFCIFSISPFAVLIPPSFPPPPPYSPFPFPLLLPLPPHPLPFSFLYNFTVFEFHKIS